MHPVFALTAAKYSLVCLFHVNRCSSIIHDTEMKLQQSSIQRFLCSNEVFGHSGQTTLFFNEVSKLVRGPKF